MKRLRHPRLAELRVRLSRLRKTTFWLSGHASMGRALRLDLAEVGSPAWKPAEDLSWRSWIEGQGDDYARDLLAAVDEILEKRAAEFVAADEAREGS